MSTVFIDSVAVGSTPYEEKYKTGEYMVKLIPQGVGTEIVSWQGKVKVYKNSLTYINRELGVSDISSAGEIFTVSEAQKTSKPNYGEIMLETDPTGAIVYLDNQEKGTSPLLLKDILKGDHELSVFIPGFLRRIQKVQVDAGSRVNASFKMAIDETKKTATDEASIATASATPTSIKKDEPKTNTAPSPSPVAKSGMNITILTTPTGFLRVRKQPSISSDELGRVNPGEKYKVIEASSGWYKISYKGTDGWISAEYTKKEE